jgi:hypothetical protein
MKTVKIQDVLALMEAAKDTLLSMPNAVQLEGMSRPLTEGERLAVSYFEAALKVFNYMGVNTSEIKIVLDTPDSDSIHD